MTAKGDDKSSKQRLQRISSDNITWMYRAVGVPLNTRTAHKQFATSGSGASYIERKSISLRPSRCD